MEAARGGDLSAFEALVGPHERRLYRLLVRMTADEAAAQDIYQESLIKAFEAFAGFRGQSAFGTWLHRIAVNQALMWLRKKGTDPLREPEELPQFDWMDAHAREIVDWSAPAEDGVLRAELGRLLNRALEEIPEIDRAIVILKDLDGLSHEEIAEATGLTVTAARTRLHRARLALRELLAKSLREKNEVHLEKNLQGSRRSIARLLGRLFGS